MNPSRKTSSRNSRWPQAFLAGVFLGGASMLAAQPLNDNFADRIPLSGARLTTTASNTNATREPGEPDDGTTGEGTILLHTVWWSWTAPADGVLAASVRGSDFPAVLDVFRGDAIDRLSSVAACTEYLRWPPCPAAGLVVTSGTAYQIAVGSANGSEGNILLNLAFFARPSNDNFANRIHLVGDQISVIGTNIAATLEPGDPGVPLPVQGFPCCDPLPPFPPDGGTVWWSWAAPASGPVTMRVEANLISPEYELFNLGPERGTGLSVLLGSNLQTLALVTNRSAALSQVTFEAVAGTTYQIEVDGRVGFFGTLTLNIARTRPPLVMLSSPLNGAQFSAGDSVAAVAETFDPDGTVSIVEFRLDQFGTERRTANVRARPFRTVWTDLAPGSYYLTARATDNLGAKADALQVSFEVRPANDDFARRIPFTGSFITVTGTLANASSEPEEPFDIDRGNVWWSWTAPSSGTFTITAVSAPGYYPTLAVFAGASLSNLTLIASSRFDGLDPTYSTRVVITAQVGIVYPIAVGTGGYGDWCTLSVAQTAPPTVTMTSPTHDASFVVGETVTFSAAADDSDGTVRRVEFVLDDYLVLGLVTNRPFTLALPFTNGNIRHRVRAWATDDAGIATRSEQVWFEVRDPGPPNDNFADRIAFTGSFMTVTGTTANATFEDEELSYVFYGSAWWAWTAPESGDFTITVRSQVGYYPSLAVFTGTTLASLQLVTNSAFAGLDYTYSTRVVVNVQAGTTYPIAVGSGGQTALSVAKTVPPSVAITSPTNNAVFVFGETINLAAEATDPDGTVSKVEFFHYNSAKVLGVVTNSPFILLLSTTNLFEGYNRLQAMATDNDGITTVSEEVEILVRPPGPPNDNFADRIAFTGSFVTVTGATANATYEAEEVSYVLDGSAWWAWTAPESGDFTITVASDVGYWPSLAVFTGSTLATLNLITNNAFSGEDSTYSTRVVLHAQAGTTYPIAAASRGDIRLSVVHSLPPSVAITSPTNDAVFTVGQTVSLTAQASDADGTVSRVEFYLDGEFLGAVSNSPFVLNITVSDNYQHYVRAYAIDNHSLTSVSSQVQFSAQYPLQANDDFSARIPLSGTLVVTDANVLNATREPGEPTPATPFDAGSVWWSWTAPASGKVTLTCSIGFSSFLGVYTGSNVTSLTVIASNTARGSFAQVVFDAVVGTEYQIAVGSRGGEVVLSLFLDAREMRLPRLLPDGLFTFQLRTTTDRIWIIEASTNLVDWLPVAAGQCADGVLEFLDPNARNFPHRFYRAVAMP